MSSGPGTLGETASGPFPVSRTEWLAVLGSRPRPLQRQPHGFLQPLAALLSTCLSPVCVVRSPLASLLNSEGIEGSPRQSPSQDP